MNECVSIFVIDKLVSTCALVSTNLWERKKMLRNRSIFYSCIEIYLLSGRYYFGNSKMINKRAKCEWNVLLKLKFNSNILDDSFVCFVFCCFHFHFNDDGFKITNAREIEEKKKKKRPEYLVIWLWYFSNWTQMIWDRISLLCCCSLLSRNIYIYRK